MIRLCGFSSSNYYNKVKLALLEKDIPFQEVLVWPDRSPDLLSKSPVGKVPFFELEQGCLCESQVMLDYIESAYPEKPLLPTDHYEIAKIRELIAFMELHVELVAREVYPQAFFGRAISDEVKVKTQKQLARNVKALSNLTKFSPFIAGSEFSMADCAAMAHLPLISIASKIIYGKDVLADLPVKDYISRLSERPAVQRVSADRKANQELMNAKMKL